MLKSLTRMSVVGGVAALAIVTSSGPAMAANLWLADYEDGRGHMIHIDDGDDFVVCDDRADGHGITGLLVRYDEYIVVSITDGGDEGCDYESYNIREGDPYQMRLYWNGQKLTQSNWFTE
jgi:hypothetical protein